ncbi:kinase-like protein [Rickenella mellea]|uniref:Kinase-like protein n=1 Tax=Rickenella mellea TaxID=50990 RepID=A0A4Y7PNE0_9AGAM|nr:kinase-like protein [Rickenella mellea]
MIQPSQSSLPSRQSMASLDEEWKCMWRRTFNIPRLDIPVICKITALMDFEIKTECLALARSDGIFKRLTTFAFIHLVYYEAPAKYLESLREALRSWESWDDQQLLSKHDVVLTTVLECSEGIASKPPLRGCDPATLLFLDLITIRRKLVNILSDPDLKVSFFNICASDPQPAVNLVQKILDNENYFEGREYLTRTISQLSKRFSCYPDCLIVVGVKRTGVDPVAGGGFADVWNGTWGGQPVALKALRIYVKSIKEKALREFAHEATVWRQLCHPNILPFCGVFKGDENFDRLCLVSPWMDSGNVMQYLIAHPSANRIELLTDVAQGLEFLHNFVSPIVHGDLKGANIFVTSPEIPRACLADFGLAYFRDSSNNTNTSSNSTGTLRWQAPELFERNAVGQARRPSDKSKNPEIFSPKDTPSQFFKLMTGCPPFKEIRSDLVVMKAILNKETPQRPEEDLIHKGLDNSMWKIMRQCWNSQSDLRPTAAALVKTLSLRTGPIQPVTRKTDVFPGPRLGRATLGQYGFRDDYFELLPRLSQREVSQGPLNEKNSDVGHSSRPNDPLVVKQAVTWTPLTPRPSSELDGPPTLYGYGNANASPIAFPSYSTAPDPLPVDPHSNPSTQDKQFSIHMQGLSPKMDNLSIRLKNKSQIRGGDARDPSPTLASVVGGIGALPNPLQQHQPLPVPSSIPLQESVGSSSSENNDLGSPNPTSAGLRASSEPQTASATYPWLQSLYMFGDSHDLDAPIQYGNAPRPSCALPIPESESGPSMVQRLREIKQNGHASLEPLNNSMEALPLLPIDDRESEVAGDTLKPEEYGWILGMLDIDGDYNKL